MRSIKSRLMLWLSITLLFALTLSGIFSHLVVQHEVDELFNAELVVTTEIIKGLVNSQQVLQNQPAVVSALNETLTGLNRIPAEIPVYRKKLYLQIWNHDGSQLLLHLPGERQTELAPMATGFYQRPAPAACCDVYVTPLPAINGWLQVGEQPQARNEIDSELGWIFVGLGAVVLAACSLLAFVAIGYGLQPLQQLGGLLRKRTLKNLQPVHLEQPPEELVPVVSGLNQLFHRLTQGLERERRFVADAAHELRTPLAVLKLRAQYLQTQAQKNIQADIDALLQSVERSHRVVEQLLLLARLEESENQLTTTATDIVEPARRVIAACYNQALQQKAGLELQHNRDTILLALNPTLFDIALRNLVENALHHGPPGNQILVALEQKREDVTITVSDTGPGVPENTLERLSERFFRGTTPASGAGLGLSIVARIVHSHGGTVQFSNRAGGGLNVCLRFPPSPTTK